MLYAEEDFKFDSSFQLSIVNINSIGEKDIGVGGRFGYQFSPVLFLDAGASYFPGGGEGRYYRKTLIFGGVRAGTRIERYGFFVNARSGAIRFEGMGFREKDVSGELHGKTYSVIDIGASLELYRSRETKENPLIRGNNLFVRIDVGNRIIFFNDAFHNGNRLGATHNPLIDLGIGLRF